MTRRWTAAGTSPAPRPRPLAAPIAEIERFLEQAWEIARSRSPQPEMMLFSDHGMTDVAETFDLFARLEGFRLGIDYVVFMDSTFARFWFPSEERRGAVLAALEGVPGQLLDDEDRRRYGIDFADRSTYGEEVLVAEEGVVFHPNYFVPGVLKQRRYPERAMHGYLPEAPSTDGIFFYRGRGLTRDLPDPFPGHRDLRRGGGGDLTSRSEPQLDRAIGHGAGALEQLRAHQPGPGATGSSTSASWSAPTRTRPE